MRQGFSTAFRGALFQRIRLFRRLDQARSCPVLWVTGPPGSGKTTLVGSYLRSRKLPCLWYQMDEGDADLATFFHYLGLAAQKAAPHRRKPLPHLPPQYLLGLNTFARRYFQELIRRHGLIPDSPPVEIDHWPWALKVFTLGRFSVLQAGGPLRFPGKAQHKPLELLKVLIAYGRGREVSPERLQEALGLYQGPFLTEEGDRPWVLPLRERLHSKLLRHLEGLGRYWEEAGTWEQAVDCYRRGLEVVPLAEELYRRLMVGYRHLDRRAEALVVYRRCRQALSVLLGVEPSPATEAIYQSLLEE